MTLVTEPIAARLKSETRELHTVAEHHPIQHGLVRGELPLQLYVANMAQLLCVHRALERALRAACETCDAVRTLVREEYFQAPRLSADLRHFGADPEMASPTPATQELCARIEQCAQEHPAALIGYLYVLEGSNNGARYIARAIRRAYNLEHVGATHLDPYGDEQPAKWAAFRETLNSLDLSPDEADAIIEAADDMFRGVSAIGDDVMAA